MLKLVSVMKKWRKNVYNHIEKVNQIKKKKAHLPTIDISTINETTYIKNYQIITRY